MASGPWIATSAAAEAVGTGASVTMPARITKARRMDHVTWIATSAAAKAVPTAASVIVRVRITKARRMGHGIWIATSAAAKAVGTGASVTMPARITKARRTDHVIWIATSAAVKAVPTGASATMPVRTTKARRMDHPPRSATRATAQVSQNHATTRNLESRSDHLGQMEIAGMSWPRFLLPPASHCATVRHKPRNGRHAWILPGAILLALHSTLSMAAAPFQRFEPVCDADGQLIVAAAVVTTPPYPADLTGNADASDTIQRAMADVAAHGGGTVYLPAGRYRLDKHLALPATVSLCGQWRPPQPGQPLAGTVLLAYADKGAAAGPALLSPPACGHANVFNLAIYYPEQNPLIPVAYPFSIEGRVAYVHNITLVNSYQGIMMSNFSGGSIADIYGTVLRRGLVLKGSCELCSCRNLRFGSDYWTDLPAAAVTPEGKAAVHSFLTRELIAVQIGKVDGLSFYNAQLAESHTPVLVAMEDDEEKVMMAPRSQYGFGGGLAKVDGRRTDTALDGWYFGTHYFDLDNYPQLAGRQYVSAAPRHAARSGPAAIYQSADFGVAADGATDDAPALQRALDQAGKAGGGTVLLPRGRAVLRAPLTIPTGVELRGGYHEVLVRPWYNNITTIIIDTGADTPDAAHAAAAISLEPGAGLRGVNLSHAQNLGELDAQGKLLIHPYPYAVRALGKNAYVYDICLSNAYQGIDLGAARCAGAQIVGLWGTLFHYGIHVGAGSDGVQLENINIDIGPLESDPRFGHQVPAVPNRHKLVEDYLAGHAVNFLLGDATHLTTFHLAGFAPHRFLEFVDEGAGGCRNAQFWSSIFDVPQVELARFTGGGPITFYGLFATGGRDHHALWAEFDPSFHGSVDVYGLCQQLSFNNRPFSAGPDQLQIHLEHSLTTGRPVTASSFAPGCGPENALDGDARTLWQSADAPGPHILTVPLAAPSLITRWRVHGAGTFLPAALNMADAELLGSSDGTHYIKLAEFHNNRQDWVDMPVICDKRVAFVRLQVTRAEAPGTPSNRARIAQFDAFGYSPNYLAR